MTDAKRRASENYRQNHKEYYREYYKKYRKEHKVKSYSVVYKNRLKMIAEDLEKVKQYNSKFKDNNGNTIVHFDIDHIEYLLKITRGEFDE